MEEVAVEDQAVRIALPAVPMIPVPANLRKGQQTAEWVAAQIRAYPEGHYQGDWFYRHECKTTMCVAGWAAFAHGPEFLNGYCRPDVSHWSPDPIDGVRWEPAGQEALQLDDYCSSLLFSGENSREYVLQALDFLASDDAAAMDDTAKYERLRQIRHGDAPLLDEDELPYDY